MFEVIKGIAVLSLLLIFIIDVKYIQVILYNLLSILILVLLICGIVSWKNKNSYASYFVIAWIGYMIGGRITMSRDQGTLPFTFFTTHAAEIGSVMEVILLSMALSSRYQVYRKENSREV